MSLEPGFSINPETWEVQRIETDTIQAWSVRPWSYAPSSYPQQAIDLARATTSLLCENVLSKYTWWKRVARWNNRGSDILLKDGRKLEAKVWRVGNSAVIKENQLRDDADFFGFVFYRTKNNLPPSYYTSKNYQNPAWELLRRIQIVVALILPKDAIVYYYNTAPVKKGIISTTGIAHRPLALSRAEALFYNAEVPWNRSESVFFYGRHNFPVKTIDFHL